MRHLNIGIIGPGGHADQSHIPHLYRQPDSRITMLADTNEARAKEINAKYGLGAQTTDNWEKLVTSPHVDVVFEVSTDSLHLPHAAGAIRNNKHVFAEKPMAVDMSQYRELRQA